VKFGDSVIKAGRKGASKGRLKVDSSLRWNDSRTKAVYFTFPSISLSAGREGAIDR
jgi:hypothetical protein